MDFGIRTKRGAVEASLSSYYIGYRNRLVAVAQCQLTAFCASAYANVGTVTSKGVEGLLVWQLTPEISWNRSASYNNSTINDDYSTQSATATTIIPAKGKTVVDAPRLLANSGLRYADSHWTGDFGLRHVDKRYFTILNTLSVPAYTVADASIGYRLPQFGRAKEMTVQFNVNNLFDASYIGPIGTGGFSLTGDHPDAASRTATPDVLDGRQQLLTRLAVLTLFVCALGSARRRRAPLRIPSC